MTFSKKISNKVVFANGFIILTKPSADGDLSENQYDPDGDGFPRA